MPDGPKDQLIGEVLQDRPAAVQEVPASVPSTDRAELLQRARVFLTSPQVRLQDSNAKRAFLEEKGLTPNEVEPLLRESPPSIPPRTYPALPPSNLPNLLIGAARIFTWLTGASAIALLVYYRYLLPRLAQSFQARIALRKHQSTLVARFTESASALKATHAESYKDFPRAVVYEDSQYAHCHTIDDLLSHVQNSREESTQLGAGIPDITILRCALEELGHSKTDGTTTEELFHHLETKLPWLGREEGAAHQNNLWNQLNICPLFSSSLPQTCTPGALPLDHPSQLLWTYVPPPPMPTPPLLATLSSLQAVLIHRREAASPSSGGRPPAPAISARQRTLQVLSAFTGYITTQTYSLGLSSTKGIGVALNGDPIEDELRREIRALKGLVLNRRSFLPLGTSASGPIGESPRPNFSLTSE